MRAEIKKRIKFILAMAVYVIVQGFKILLLIILIAGQLTGASLFEEPVHYKEFTIKEFEDFNSIPIEKEEQYMRSGRLEFAKVDDVFIIPYIWATDQTAFKVSIYAYSTDKRKNIRVESVSLTVGDEIILYSNKNFDKQIIVNEKGENMFSGFVLVNQIEESEDWCFEGNPMTLNIQVSVEGAAGITTKDMSYNVDVVF